MYVLGIRTKTSYQANTICWNTLMAELEIEELEKNLKLVFAIFIFIFLLFLFQIFIFSPSDGK